MQPIPSAIRTLLKSRSMAGTSGPRAVVTFTKPGGAGQTIQVSSVRISRGRAELAQTASVAWANVNPADPTDVGYYSPDRGDDDPAQQNEWYQVILPGTKVVIQMGYGADLATVFTGEIDDVHLRVDPTSGDLYSIQVEARDYGWRLIDKQVSGAGSYTLSYTATPIEDIVSDLLQRAGWAAGEITTEPTGLAATVTFDRTYAEAIEWCREATGFDLVIDETGRAHWIYPTDRQPAATNLQYTLTGTNPVTITGGTDDLGNPEGNAPIVSGSEVVTDDTGATTYVRSVDYTLDYATGELARIDTGAIPDGGTVLVDYVYPAWTFRQGEDLFRIGYTISRRNVYGQIRVIGTQHTGWYAYAGRATYGIPDDKILTVDLPELATQGEVDAAAAQMGNDMVPHVRQVQFAAVGHPWIQLGDCIQVVETSTTISEIYRVASLELELDRHGFMMSGVAMYYGYAPLQG